MAQIQVPDKVLAWLYTVLQQSYHDVPRTYSNTARALAAYPSLAPRTEVHTSNTGASALLLTLSGTLPVTFRGTLYRFPVKLWVPQAYPREVPMVYIVPGADMLVRPGQHVGVDGRVYHPYLRGWQGASTMVELLGCLQEVFGREPPVIGKAQREQFQPRAVAQQSPQMGGGGAGPPLLPPKQRVGHAQPVEMPSAGTPPPRPPKPGDDAMQGLPLRSSSRQGSGGGPPLPPLPHERPRSQQFVPAGQQHDGYAAAGRPSVQGAAPQYQNGRPPGPPVPPLPPQSYQQHPQQQGPRINRDASPVSPVSPMNGYSQLREAHYLQHAPPNPQSQRQSHYQPPAPYPPQQYHPQAQYQQPPQQQPQYAPPQHYTNTNHPAPPHQQYSQSHTPKPRAPPPDLLSDPFEIALPGLSASNSAGPAPPIPPNPEREHLLHALSTALVQQTQAKVAQNLSALGPLQVQHNALQTAHHNLTLELRQLENLTAAIESNTSILHQSIQACDTTIREAAQKKQPPIDDVLVAPTLVANQLWTLCAEEAAAREAMYVLQRALERGRVEGGTEGFVRVMRGLGREVFGKMVLGRKCGKGLGLVVGPGGGR